MAMRGGTISIATVRMRMERLEERTAATVLPPIEDLFRVGPENPELTKQLVDSMTFSQYPGAKEFSASSLKAFLANTKNLNEFRASGSIGSLLEVIRRTDIKNDCLSVHVDNIVKSLHILLKDDSSMMSRLLAHPFGVKTVVRLCKYTQGQLQYTCFEMLEWIHRTDSGPHELLKQQILRVLLHPTFMYKKTTTVEVRNKAAHMISQLTPFAGNMFDVFVFNKILVDPDVVDRNGNGPEKGGVGRRRVDGYMEMQLLASFLSHMAWRDRHGAGPLPFLLTTASHLIEEVKSETFESVEHMQQIMRILVVLSKDSKHADYMWNHSLGSALQYLVRTDFALFRRKASTKQGSAAQEKSKMDSAKGKGKRKSILDTGDRPPATLLFLSLVKPTAVAQTRNEDINLFCTRYVTILYENIMNIKLEIIHDLVSSGIISALLFRVGSGSDRDPRFNKVVSHFLHQLLIKVMVHQPHKGYHMALIQQVKVNSGNVESYQEFAGGEKAAEKEATVQATDPDVAEKDRLRVFVRRGDPCPASSDLSHDQLLHFLDPAVIAALDIDKSKPDTLVAAFGARRPPTPPKLAPADLKPASHPLPLNQLTIDTKKPSGAPKLNLGKPVSLTIQVVGSPSGQQSRANSAGLTPGPGFRKKMSKTPSHMVNSEGEPFEYDVRDGAHMQNLTRIAPAHATSTVDNDGYLVFDSENSIDSFEQLTLPEMATFPVNTLGQASVSGKSKASMDTAGDIHMRKVLQQSKDLRGISNTLVAQGIVESFMQTLSNNANEDPVVVKESLVTLSILVFGTYWEKVTNEANLEALFMVSRARIEYFYAFLSILVDMIMSPEVPMEMLEGVMTHQKCLNVLVRALNMSGWIFHRKDLIYRCVAKLAVSGHFMQCLQDAQGVSVMCREVLLRKAMARQNQREGDGEGDGTPKLLGLLRRDLAALKIQAQVRRRQSCKRQAREREDKQKMLDMMHSVDRRNK